MSSWDYLDFELEIREGGSGGYAVAVHSPAGEAQEEMSFPFDERQLRDKLKDLEIALLRSGGTRRSLSTEEQTVQEFGRSLFEATLVGKVGTAYYRSMDQAQQEGKGLRLKLHVKPPNLTVLPWEFLYDPDRDEYLCFSRDTPIVRYTDLRRPIGRLSVEPPLRILGMVASPRDLAPLDVEHEKGLMNEAIEDLQADGLVKLTWLEGETWRDLQRAMRRDGPWNIFHFVGHGDFDLNAQEGLMAFTEKSTGRRHLLRSRDLARLLDGHPSLRLVFLNSCEGARGSEGDPFSGTASTLVRRGIPAVVAMQYQITDKAAIEFCSAFYESLADGLPVDAAVTEARVAVSMDSVLEWGTPVLFMRSRDGRLFDISTEKRPSEQPRGATDQEELHEHQERTTREQERKEQLDTLYAQARRSHQNQDWHAVVDVFDQISEVDQDYPDDEGLLESALEALMRERKERDALRRYREAVKSTSKEGLNQGRAQSLRDLANKLELSASAASRIEQEVMDDTKEVILERLEGLYDEARQLHQNREWQAVIDKFARIYLEDANYPDHEGLLASAHDALETAKREEESLRKYREVVESAWADNHVSDADTEQLGALARELDLNMDTVVTIERDVMGDTKEAILERQEQAAREKDRQDRLDQLYARARRSHQNQEWQVVLDIFAEIHAEEPAYPDPDGLLASVREALEIAQKKEDALRQYREGVESAWTTGELDRRQAERLRDLANELELNSSAVADVEREVMGDTIEEILERHEQAAREEERQKYLDELYGRARGLHRDQEWQAVLDIFAEIHAEEPAYADPEELLKSARNALERTRKEQDTIRRYREAVVWAWVDEDLNGREVMRLRDLESKLELSSNTAAGIEREIMGETKEAILERQEQASAEHYRTAVEEASTDNELSNAEGVWLRNLASELGLSSDTAADIEREVTGDTIPAILQRQRRLDELYVQARQLHQGQEWQSVVDVFEQIHSEDANYPDREGLLASAREALDQVRKVADLYVQALRYVDGSKWQQALERFEEVQRLEPGYRDTEELLSQVRRELAPPPTAKIPDLSGQEVSQANSALTSKGLRLGAQSEAPSDTVPDGQIIEQSLAADTEVEIGSSVSVTVSSGPSTVEIPALVGKSRDEAESILRAAGLELGQIGKVSSDDLPEGQIVQQLPVKGSKAERGASVRVIVTEKRVEEPKTEKPTKRPLSSRPDFLPEEPEPRQSGKPADLPD
jgi:chorismate mutase